jgi:GDP-L-fucose synthase
MGARLEHLAAHQPHTIHAMEKKDKIYVAGHRGMVGSAIVRRLRQEGYERIVTRTHRETDLTDQKAVAEFFAMEKPDVVVLAAAKVGGIHANNVYRAQFLHENLMIQNNVIDHAYRNGVKKLLFLGSSCIYPKMAPQPLKEESLLTGPLEQTNEPYAIAKIAGIKMAESYRRQYGVNYISAMPTNLYGPNDNYDLNNSHVLPALIRKFHTAKVTNADSVEVWGTGSPRREFLHVDDLADACVFLLKNYDEELFVNVGTGEDLTIKELAEMIKDIVGFRGALVWNTEKPDGTPRKLMDVSRLHALGWKHRIGLREGIASVYTEFAKSELARA